MILAKLRKQIGELIRQRYKLEKEILDVLSRNKLLRGSLVIKYKACNKGGCKCTKGKPHGPFLYLSDKEEGKTKMVFIRRDLKERVRRYNKRYRCWRQLRARLVKINRQILALLDELGARLRIKLEEIEKSK